jgi:hypothetical protein
VLKYALLHQPQKIKNEIENLGHTVTNICNIKQYKTKLPLSMFFLILELEPVPNNEGIFNVEYIRQCKIKFEPLKPKRTFLNVQTVKDMGPPKIIAVSNRDASNAQVTI